MNSDISPQGIPLVKFGNFFKRLFGNFVLLLLDTKWSIQSYVKYVSSSFEPTCQLC